jgi:two-component system sensor histidine kinase KdpD
VGEERRPDPEKILERIREDTGRGRLTVFLGAAAGVGKTYAMLEAAHEHLGKGLDVVIGWLDTHGRKETQALAEGIELLPAREVEYHGVTLREMDLDALLARHPQVAIVDELAHTNVAGSRHAKRYQDVEELLDAGIHVFTALNVQHVDSLNDVVQQITGVVVRETVPDRILDQAAEIRLVDLPPEELIHRLEEGKVYVPAQAAQALQRFFRPGNLNALRELALRKTTERVGGQLDTYMRRHDIEGPWAVRDRIVVCVGPSPFSANLIRVARRMAAQSRCEWIAATVEQPGRPPLNDAQKARLAENVRLAEELGAQVVSLTGDDVADTVARFAREHNVTQIVIGKPLKARLAEAWRGSLADRLIGQCPGIDIHVIPGEAYPREKRLRIFPGLRPRLVLRGYIVVLAGMALLTAILVALRDHLNVLDLNLIYLLPIMLAAMRWGIGPAFAAALLGLLCIDFFFVPPFYSLTVAQPGYAFTLGVFVTVGIIISGLAGRLKHEVQAAQTREARTEALFRMSRIFVAVEETQELLDLVAEEVAEDFATMAAILLPDETGRLSVQAYAPRSRPGGETALSLFDDNEIATATWAYQHGQTAGKGTDTLAGASALYVPLQATRGAVGVLAVAERADGERVLPEEWRMLQASADLIAVAVERLQLTEQARRADVLTRMEKLHLALLDSVSHDLRTPLASILGSVTSILEDDHLHDAESRRRLLGTIRDEAARMNHLIGNLLDMARIESGTLRLKRDWCDVADIVGAALSRVGRALEGRPIETRVPDDLPLLLGDFVLIEQVLVNLLDNAVKYSPVGSGIEIAARGQADLIEIVVRDRGFGILKEDLEAVFDKFHRVHRPGESVGTGLGLSICRGIVEASGGSILARQRDGGGTEIVFTLPAAPQAPMPQPEADEEGPDER